MENINQRVFELLGEERGISSKLSRYLEVKDSTVSNWKIRGSEIPAKYIFKIAEFLGVSETYLLTGKEEQNKNDFFSQDEIALIMAYRELPLSTKEFVFNSVTAQPIQRLLRSIFVYVEFCVFVKIPTFELLHST